MQAIGLLALLAGCWEQQRRKTTPMVDGDCQSDDAAPSRTNITKRTRSNGVPARLGKGQGAKEIGHNLAREAANDQNLGTI